VLAPKVDPAADGAALVWAWPASGAVIERFSDTNRGIDIGGKPGQAVLASADGRVVYSGSAIRGYGRMLIVKHNDQYVSVYAHAAELLVKEGQPVSRGQRIADMGSTDADRVKLHFEIRRMGRPIDPLRYLPGEGAS
ncbi:MAG: peptidoglycan DD-metalloendopeptidase family protein, partial [Proteobacteria bacterium]|nr:peptidoglycan DD-metalloendopeptidase family protein [Burkholderiales bacterium]